MNTRQQFVKGMVRDAYDYAMEKYDEKPTIFDQVFEAESSADAYEQYTSVLGPGSMTETEEGESITRRTATEGFTVYCANKKFADELPLTNEAIDDNTKIKNFLKTWAQGLGEAARASKEQRHADIFNKGGHTAGHSVFLNDINNVLTTSYGNLAYDSKPFLTASGSNRTAKHGGTYFNAYTTLNLSEANLQTVYQRMVVSNAYNEAGRKIELRPDVLLVQAGSNNAFTARRIIESMAQVDGGHSGVANLWKNKLRVIEWSYLDTAASWYLGIARTGLKSLARKALTIDYYEDKRHDAQIVRGITRFGCAVTNFRPWVGANVATS